MESQKSTPMDPKSKSSSATGMSALVRRVLGAGPRFKKKGKRVSAEEQEDYFSSKSKGSSSSSSSTDSSEMESETDSEDCLKMKERKRPRRVRPRTFRKQRSYQTWIGNRPRLALSCLRLRIVHMVRLMKTMAFLRRLRNVYRRVIHAAGSSKAVLSLTDLYYAVANIIPRAEDEKGPPANDIIVLRPIMLQSSEKRNLVLNLRNRADIQALRESLRIHGVGSGALTITNGLVT